MAISSWQQVAADDVDESVTQKNTNPSGASSSGSLNPTLRGFNPDFGGEVADLQASNTIVRGNSNF